MLDDTQVSTTIGASLAYSFIARDAVALIGAERSSVSAAIASIAQERNVMQLSYKTGNERLSNKGTFPLFGTVRSFLFDWLCN